MNSGASRLSPAVTSQETRDHTSNMTFMKHDNVRSNAPCWPKVQSHRYHTAAQRRRRHKR